MESHQKHLNSHEITMKILKSPPKNPNVFPFASQVLSLFDEALEPAISVAFDAEMDPEAEAVTALLPETWADKKGSQPALKQGLYGVHMG